MGNNFQNYDQLEDKKNEAIKNDMLKHALFYQQEQIIIKLNSISWFLKQLTEGQNK